MKIQRFLVERPVDSASGSQIFYVDATSESEAIRKHKLGEGDIYANECEVTSLGEPCVTGTVELDDFGMSGEKSHIDVSELTILLRDISETLPSSDPLKERILNTLVKYSKS